MTAHLGARVFFESNVFQVRLHMNKLGRFVWLPAAGLGIAVLLMTTGLATAQNPVPGNPIPEPQASMSVPMGYTVHEAVDVGGRMTNLNGSSAMYGTMVNMGSGPGGVGDRFDVGAFRA